MYGTLLRGRCKTAFRTLRTLASAVVALSALGAVLVAGTPARATSGANGIHDPSNIIKVGSTYHIYGTGQGIYHLTSTNLTTWSVASSVFGSGSGPSWIQTYVPGFTGFFWAPEIVKIGSKYFLYYACSLGAKPCAIGVATSTDLNTWTDQGMVVYSDNNTTYGSIDPGVFQDASGNWWMTWGSHLTGIWIAQLNANTGKFLNSTKTNIANFSDAEASNVTRNGSYYYLFYNRGVCCNGTASTYYINVARATSPNGPYTGNRVFMSGSSPFYGPGQAGFYAALISYHYYDGNNNGAPTLGISNLNWSGGWPSYSNHY